MIQLGLIPLDERPANIRYPAMIARIAGVDLHIPPPSILSSFRTPAPCDTLAQWLYDVASDLDALIVSCEMLGYGGLIASRITDEPANMILTRLALLRSLKRRYPALTILGFNLITRISNANSATEEPAYWAEYGTQLYQLSQLIDRQTQHQPVAAELATLQAALPEQHVHDFLRRRLRNHVVNLGTLQLLADGVFDLLVLSSDDTSAYGLPSREKRWITEWAEWLGLGGRLLMYPGADEVGCALLARLINQHTSSPPRFKPYYAVPGGEYIVAPYEDGPVRVTVERQIRAVGGIVDDQDADIWLAINPPVARRSEWHPGYAEQEHREQLPYLQALVRQARQRQDAGQHVVVADVAYPNGADPVLVDLLCGRVRLPELTAYGAWNTAGNTIGTVLAQACAARQIHSEEQRTAHEQFLLHRLIEDWGYQQLVRRQVRNWLEAQSGAHEPTPATLPAVIALIEEHLQALIASLPEFAGRWQIVPGSVRLPWNRTFEVDFELERTNGV